MKDKINDSFLGRWKLIDCYGLSGNEKSYPFGKTPFGMLIYTRTYMSVFASHDDRHNFSSNDLRDISESEIARDFSQYETYCGTYAIAINDAVVKHFIESSKVPNQVGTQLTRVFTFYGNKLILQTNEPMLLNGKLWNFFLKWEKVEGFM